MIDRSKIMRAIPILAIAILAASSGKLVAPALAFDHNDENPVALSAKTSDPLIDKDFEDALLKHFQKRFFTRIDATDAQRGKLSSILQNRMTATRPLREKLREEAVTLTDMMAKDDTTDDQIAQQAAVIRGLRDQLGDERLKTVLQVRSVLTSAQRQQISDKLRGLLTGEFKPQRLIGGVLPGRLVIGQLLINR